MLVGQELLKHSNGDVFTRNYYDFGHVAKANHNLKKEIGNGFTDTREMRHETRIPAEMDDINAFPLIYHGLRGDETSMRLAIAKYPFIKVCDGNI